MESTDSARTEATWLVVTGPNGKYIVKTPKTQGAVLTAMDEGRSIPCDEAYDFVSQVHIEQQGQQLGIGKRSLATRIDATAYPVGLFLSLQGAMVYFLDNLKESDAHQYKKMIQAAAGMAEAQARDRAGLVAPAPPQGMGQPLVRP